MLPLRWFPVLPLLGCVLVASAAQAQTSRPKSRVRSLGDEPELRSPTEAFAYVGRGPGQANILLGEARPGGAEILLDGFALRTRFWHVLRHDPQREQYVDRFVSPVAECGDNTCFLREMRRGDVLGSIAPEVVLAYSDGQIEVFDEGTGDLVAHFATGVGNIRALDVGDVDHDGKLELVLLSDDSTTQGVWVFDGSGSFLWNLIGPDGQDLAVGQLDDDPGLEIATSFGDVIDADTRLQQWDPEPFIPGALVSIGQLDDDRPQELVIARAFGTIWAYDVEFQSEKWQFENFNTAAVELGDLDGDGIDEVLVGDFQHGGITIYDGSTLAEEGFIQNPDIGVPAIAIGDVDDDPELEIVWGTGGPFTGTDCFYVTDAVTLETEWEAVTLQSPLIGPVRGDVDGDGQTELVVTAARGGFGFGQGNHILILDEKTLRPRVISPPLLTTTSEFRDLVLADVDDDGDSEVVVAGKGFNAQIWIFDVDSEGTFTEIWTNQDRPNGASFRSILVEDIDSDGELEVFGCTGGESTGNEGNAVYVYDLATGLEERRTISIGDTFEALTKIVTVDWDDDGVDEILALFPGNSVWHFNGRTLDVEFVLGGTVEASPSALGSLKDFTLVGQTNGEVLVIRPPLSLGFSFQATDGPVDAVSARGALDEFYVASAGRLTSFEGALGDAIWTTADYGPTMGDKIVFLPDGRVITSANYAVLGFGPGSTAPSVRRPARRDPVRVNVRRGQAGR